MKSIIPIEVKPPTHNEAKQAALYGVNTEIAYFISLVGLAFHPDTRFQEYTFLDSDKKVFPARICRSLNARLTECFDMCRIYGMDIYELSLNHIKTTL